MIRLSQIHIAGITYRQISMEIEYSCYGERERQSDAVGKPAVRFPRARNREANLNFCSGGSYIAAALASTLRSYVA